MFPRAPSSIYQSPTCFVTYGTMGHIDPKQPPGRGKPWKCILAQDFIHRVDLIAPQECCEVLHRKLVAGRQSPGYSRVIMSLAELLDGAFFAECVKTGAILMLSEGRVTTDNMFTLRHGVLTMYLDKETYERAGLVGKPYGPKGDRGLKPRWVVTYDLTSSTMLHGKKGFDRLVYACKKVLSRPLTWLACLVAEPASSSGPLEKHFPANFASPPAVVQNTETANVDLAIPVSILANGDRAALEEVSTELYEWTSLIRLDSPRTSADDKIDPYLSRYGAPGDAGGRMQVCKISWQGFFSAIWFRDLLVDVVASCPSQSWFALASTEFSKSVTGSCDEVALLRPAGAAGEYIMWDTKGLD